MEYTIVHRDPQAFQQAVSLEHMKAMCERAFGQGTLVDSVRELDGGQFNNTYLIELADARLVPLGCTVATPREAGRRGGAIRAGLGLRSGDAPLSVPTRNRARRSRRGDRPPALRRARLHAGTRSRSAVGGSAGAGGAKRDRGTARMTASLANKELGR